MPAGLRSAPHGLTFITCAPEPRAGGGGPRSALSSLPFNMGGPPVLMCGGPRQDPKFLPAPPGVQGPAQEAAVLTPDMQPLVGKTPPWAQGSVTQGPVSLIASLSVRGRDRAAVLLGWLPVPSGPCHLACGRALPA